MDDIQQLYNEYNRNTADAINSIDSVNKASKKPNLSEYISAVFFDDTIYEAAASSGDDEQSCNEEVDDVNGNFDETNTGEDWKYHCYSFPLCSCLPSSTCIIFFINK